MNTIEQQMVKLLSRQSITYFKASNVFFREWDAYFFSIRTGEENSIDSEVWRCFKRFFDAKGHYV